MQLNIQTGENNIVLRKKSVPVRDINKNILKLIRDMEIAMKNEKGVGLAAPQVGQNIRLIIVLMDNKNVVTMINPEITDRSDDTEYAEEGCLSLPGKWGQVERFKEIIVKFQNAKGEKIVMRLGHFNARVVQHEIDHLDGILFTDYLNDINLNNIEQRETERL